MSEHLVTYGTELKPDGLKKFLEHIFTENDKKSGPGTPVCIWGTHGLGKTHIAKAFATDRNWQFRDVPVAQFEEMGDLHGMPEAYDPTPDKPDSGDEYTYFMPPAWVPTEEGPGILLLDDFNRADDRILRGIMQLLQNFALTSWALPPKWQIVATANPEGGDYSITPLDDAMLTRMIHTTLVFDALEWARWADSAGIDKRGISFVLNRYLLETVTFKRTTPRTLEQFFRQIENIEDLQKEEELVQNLASGTLDDVTVGDFLSFVRDDLTELIDPEDILNAENFEEIDSRLQEIGTDEEGKTRMDRQSTICTRLFIFLKRKDYTPGDRHAENLCAFLKSNNIEKDLTVGIAKKISKETDENVRGLLRSDAELSKLLLGAM